MNFIILADKYQKGMKSKGCVGLIKINKNNNVLQYQYKTIKSYYPSAKIIYIYGFDSKKFTNFIHTKEYPDLITICNEKYEEFNYSYSLSLATKYLDKNCFILFGDTIFKKNIFDNFNINNGSQIYINQKEKTKLGCVIDNQKIVSNISFDLDNYLMDIYFIHRNNAEHFVKFINNPKFYNCFLFEIINRMIDHGVKIKAIVKNKKNVSPKLYNKTKV